MSEPVRLQLSRKAGFDLQALSHATNQRPAVVVARPSAFGNPVVVGKLYGGHAPVTAAQAVEIFRNGVLDGLPGFPPMTLIQGLRGLNLACWCKLGAGVHCHAEILLELANK